MRRKIFPPLPGYDDETKSRRYDKIEGFKLGVPVKTTVECTAEGNVATYGYFINGTLIKTFKAALPEKDKNGKFPTPFFTSWRVDKLTIDNFKISEVKKSGPSVNRGKAVKIQP